MTDPNLDALAEIDACMAHLRSLVVEALGLTPPEMNDLAKTVPVAKKRDPVERAQLMARWPELVREQVARAARAATTRKP